MDEAKAGDSVPVRYAGRLDEEMVFDTSKIHGR